MNTLLDLVIVGSSLAIVWFAFGTCFWAVLSLANRGSRQPFWVWGLLCPVLLPATFFALILGTWSGLDRSTTTTNDSYDRTV